MGHDTSCPSRRRFLSGVGGVSLLAAVEIALGKAPERANSVAGAAGRGEPVSESKVPMEYRLLGESGLKVPVLGFGTATFGGSNEFYRRFGKTQVREATRLIDVCLEAGTNLFDTADSYSEGLAETILGEAVRNRRDRLLIATKGGDRTKAGPNGLGTSRHHLIESCEASLRRLKTDYIDLYQVHVFDPLTPQDETLRALDDLIRTGKVRYIGCSNYSGWHLMKALSLSKELRLNRYVSHQVSYTLIDREFEWELMSLALDQKVGTIVWGPLAGGRLAGRVRRGQLAPSDSRVAANIAAGRVYNDDEVLFRIIDVMDEISRETGKTLPQIALNWLLQRPTVSSVLIGARDEKQLRENLGALGWRLTPEQMLKLDAASDSPPIYPYSHQRRWQADRN